jgi:hypothetical protein
MNRREGFVPRPVHPVPKTPGQGSGRDHPIWDTHQIICAGVQGATADAVDRFHVVHEIPAGDDMAAEDLGVIAAILARIHVAALS